MPEFLDAGLVVDAPVVHALGLALLHSLWQGLLIGLLFKVVLSALSGAAPDVRYWAGVSALALLAVSVPLTTVYLLADAMPAGAQATAAVAAGIRAAGSLPAESSGIFSAGLLIEWTVALWIAGVTIISTRTLLAWRRLSALRRDADLEAAAPLMQLVESLSSIFRLRGHVAIGLSASIGSPMVIGWLKPVILLPPAIAARLPRQQLEMIIAHELAHLRRHDHWVNLFQIVIETLMFYHPVVAMISRRIRIERESACDDLAVAATHRRLDYVEMLAALEKTRDPGPALALGVHDGQVLARIRRLVERSEPRAHRGAAVPALVALVTAGALVAIPVIDEVAPERQPPESPSLTTPEIATAPATVTRPTPVAEIRDDPAPEQSGRKQQRDGQQQPNRPERPNRPEQPGPVELPAIEGVDAVVAQPDAATAGVPAPDDAHSDDAAPLPMVDDDPAEADTRQTAANIEKPATRPIEAADPRPSSLAEARPEPLEIETPRLDPSVLLARRIDNTDVLPEYARETANPTEPVNGDAQRVAGLVFDGGELLREVHPDYPRTALRREIAGSVEVELLVDTSGRVGDVAILSETPADAGFAAAARRAARQWEFEPYTRDGEPVTQRKTVVFDFEPGEGCQVVTGTRLPSC